MRNETLGGYPSIDSFVRAKLDRLFSGELSFSRLFSEMFSEGGNVLYERSRGYKIEYTRSFDGGISRLAPFRY